MLYDDKSQLENFNLNGRIIYESFLGAFCILKITLLFHILWWIRITSPVRTFSGRPLLSSFLESPNELFNLIYAVGHFPVRDVFYLNSGCISSRELLLTL